MGAPFDFAGLAVVLCMFCAAALLLEAVEESGGQTRKKSPAEEGAMSLYMDNDDEESDDERCGALAGVSAATVSRTLYNHPEISSEIKEKVRAAFRTLGYIPNAAARG